MENTLRQAWMMSDAAFFAAVDAAGRSGDYYWSAAFALTESDRSEADKEEIRDFVRRALWSDARMSATSRT